MKKRIMSVFATLIMLIGQLQGTAFAIDPAYNANSLAGDSSSLSAASTEASNYYEISTVDELYQFAALVNGGKTDANAILMNDIVFTGGQYWTPIGNYQAQYIGTFDGNGKTITGLTYTDAENSNSSSYVGLFGAVTGGTIKNLTLNTASIVTASGKYGAGIVVGNLTGGSVSNVTLTNCTLEKTACNDVCLGGIVGYNAGTISNCSNSGGTVKSTGGSSCFVGGIAGRNGTKDAEIGTIINCSNSVEISTISGYDCVGGIVGKNTNKPDQDSVVSGCTNSGTIKGATSWGGSRIGGIVGDNDGMVTDCINNGTISSSNTSVETTWDTEFSAGGIVGANDGKIERCGNSGTICGIQHCGGIAGYFNNSAGYIKNCWNIGQLIPRGFHGSALCAAGIVGHLLDGTIENCWSQVYYKPYDSSNDLTNHFTARYAIVGVQETDPRYTGTVRNCWYSVTPGEQAGNDVDDGLAGTEMIATSAVQNGKLAYLLNGSSCSVDAVWHQTLGTDKHPVPDSGHSVVWQTCGNKAFSNSQNSAEEHSYDPDGFCLFCGAYEPATPVTASNYETLGLTSDYVGYYAIASAGQLYWFSDFTTRYEFSFSDDAGVGKADANAVLIADITVNSNVLSNEGKCTDYTDRRVWLPICGTSELPFSEEDVFSGIFDGNGHTISGLFSVCEAGILAGSSAFPEKRASETDPNYAAGVVGILGDGGCVRNLTVTDSFFSGAITGSIVGATLEDTTNTIEGCIFSGHIRPNIYVKIVGSVNGGLVGAVLGTTTVKNCVTTGIVEDLNDTEDAPEDYYVGGIAGAISNDTSLTCENVLYIKQASSVENMCYDLANDGSMATYPSVVMLDPAKFTGTHTVDIPIAGLLSMDENTTFNKNVYTLGGTSWPDGNATGIWPGKAGESLTLTLSLDSRQFYTANVDVQQGDAASLVASVTMAKQSVQQILSVDLTTINRYLNRGNPVFTLDDWTTNGLTSASLNGNILTLVAENTTQLSANDTIMLSVSGLLDYRNPCTVTVTVTYVDKTAVQIEGIQTAGDLIYSGNGQVGFIGTPISEYTGTYEIVYTGIDNTTYGPSSTAPKDVGTYTVTISVPESNVQYTGNVTLNFSIKQASQVAPTSLLGVDETVHGKNDGKITGVNDSMEYKLIGADSYSTISGTEIGGLAAGTYLVRYKETANYLASEDTEITIHAGEKPVIDLIWSGFSTDELVYSGTAKTMVATATGLANGDTCTVTVELVGDNVNVGTFYYKATALSNPNYKLPADVTSPAYTITAKQLTVSADNHTVYVGSDQPELTYKVEGLVGLDVLITTPTLTTDANMATDGVYTITVAGADAGSNYTISYVNGTLTVEDYEVDLVWSGFSADELVYSGTAKTMVATATGLANGDTCTVTVELVGDNVNVGTFYYKATALSNPNYKLPADVTSPAYTITAKQLTVSADNHTVYVGSDQPELTYKVEGLVGLDVLITTPTLATDANMATDGVYTITVGGADAGSNYTISYVNGTLTVENYPYIPLPTYDVKIAGEISGGEVIASRKTAYRGNVITLSISPDPDYELSELTVTDSKGNAIELTKVSDSKYTFTMPRYDVNVTADFAKIDTDCTGNSACPMHNFTDLDPELWYHDGIHYCLENGLMIGTSTSTFEAGTASSRAMIVTILWRLEGCPAVNHLMSFEDVSADSWYIEAVRWANAEGIAIGYGSTFGPNDPITREQLATIMWRYAKYKGYDVTVEENTNILSYGDALDISEWATLAMQWACGSGLLQGVSNGGIPNLLPTGTATRAESATIFYRYCKFILKEH